ncbi:hypothetical protein ACFWVU_31060 [Streptomyces sp. NPDC058686]|uniref:hypothetical protein n=1 Tax=Streptomyces sp. NPDC058686 TaxID=3346599 RepID=UPI003653B2CD
MTAEAVLKRRPTGARKRELTDGAMYIYGEFHQRDSGTDRRTNPGRPVLTNHAGVLEVVPITASASGPLRVVAYTGRLLIFA